MLLHQSLHLLVVLLSHIAVFRAVMLVELFDFLSVVLDKIFILLLVMSLCLLVDFSQVGHVVRVVLLFGSQVFL